MRRPLGPLLLATATAVVVGLGPDPAASQDKTPPGPLRWGLVKVDLRAKNSKDTANKGTTVREYTYTKTTYEFRHLQTDESGQLSDPTGRNTYDRRFLHTFSVPPSELVEGQTFDVTVTGKTLSGGELHFIGVTASASGYGGIEMQETITLDGRPFPKELIHRTTYLGNHNNAAWNVKESVATYRATVPSRDKAKKLIGISFNAGSPNLGSTLVSYDYELGARPIGAPPGPNPNPNPNPGPGPAPNPHPGPEPGPLPPLPDNVRREIDAIRAVLRTRGESFTVGHTGVSHLSLGQLCGFRIPQGIDLGAYVQHVNQRGRQWLDADVVRRTEFERTHPNVLPEIKVEPRRHETEYGRKSRFDWRDYGKVTPVTNQGSCGSCWDFAAMGAFECSHLIRNDATIRASEQQALDCVKKGNCTGGWHMDVFDFLAGHGGCPGAAYPYTGSKGDKCKPVSSPYRAVSWAFVAPDGRQPPVDALKAAIVKHGPVACVLHATPAFLHYTGGVFDEHDNALSKDTHVVLIVGWDDSKGKGGAWAVRNSWGTQWGENGYAWVSYGSNGIGDHAAWVEAESTHYKTMTLLMNDYRVKQGTDVYAPVHLLNPADVKNMDWVVDYDPAVARLVEPSVLNGTVPLFAFKANPFEARRVLLGFAEDTPINAGGQLARIHFKAVGPPGSRTPLGLELKTARDPKRQPLAVRLVPGSIEVMSGDETDRLRGSCCGLQKLVLEDALCALEMSVRLRPTDLIMNMNPEVDNVVDSTDAAIIIDRVMANARAGQ